MENNQIGAEKKQRLSIGAIIVLVLINSFTLYLLFTENKARIDVTTEKMVLLDDFKKLTDSVAVKNSEIEQFIGKNAELDKSIAEKQVLIEKQKTEIRNLLAKNKMTVNELAKAKILIAQYETSLADITAQVDDLTRRNEQLMAQNQQLSNDLGSEKLATAQLTEQNRGLAKKVEVGSLLPIAKVDVDAIKRKTNGKEVTVKRAKVAESLRISFETGENKVIDPGQVDLYLRIINPKGETIAVSDQGSGTIATAESAEPVQYTKKAEIEYQQSNKKVVVYWSQNIQSPGVYKVQLYQSGRVVGEGEVKLS